MRRDEIIFGFDEAAKFCRQLSLGESFYSILTDRTDHDVDLLLLFQRILEEKSSLNDKSLMVLDYFGLTQIFHSEFWGDIVKQQSGVVGSGGTNISEIYRNVMELEHVSPFLISILTEGSWNHLSPRGNAEEKTDEVSNLRLLIKENESQFSSVDRFVTVLSKSNDLYNCFLVLEGEPENTLSVRVWDSGSDKEVDLLGAGKAVSALSKLLIEVWDKIRFRKEDSLRRRVLAVAESTDAIKAVEALNKKGSISPEQAQSLKNRIIDSVSELFESGVYLQEMDDDRGKKIDQLIEAPQALLTDIASDKKKKKKSDKKKKKK